MHVALASAASAPAQLTFVFHLCVVLVTALVGGYLARRFLGVPILGEIVAGVCLGAAPVDSGSSNVLSWLIPTQSGGDASLFRTATTVCAVVLVGHTALQLDLRALRSDRRAVVRVAAGAFLLPGILGMLAAAFLPRSLAGGSSPRLAFIGFIGIAVAISALPVAAITLQQLGLLRTRLGRLVLASAALDDLAGWLALAVLTAALAESAPTTAVISAVALVGLAVAAVVLPRPLAPVMKFLAQRSRMVLPVLLAALIVAGGALSAQAAGLEPVIGALASGLVLSRCAALPAEVVRVLDGVVRWFCAPLFLASAGMRVRVPVLEHPTVALAALALLLVAIGGKVAGAVWGARIAGLPNRLALATGAGLNARGMVEIVIASVGVQIGVLSEEMYAILVAIAVVTSLITPVALRLAMPSGHRAAWASPVAASRAGASDESERDSGARHAA